MSLAPSKPVVTPARELPLEGWVVVAAMWFSFGLSTLLNALALLPLNETFERNQTVILPESMREAIWLVLGLWLSGYLAALLLGFFAQNIPNRTLTYSVIVGYELAILCRLMIINVFPVESSLIEGRLGVPTTLPVDPYDVVVNLFNLNTPHPYHSFVVLVVFLGPVFVGLAAASGYWLRLVLDGSINLPTAKIEPRALLTSTILPLALLFFIMGFINLWEGNDNPLDRLEILFNPAYDMLVAAICGVIVGASKFIKDRRTAIFSVVTGIMIHLQIMILLKQFFVSNIAYGEFTDPLNLLLPRFFYFIALWLGPILTAALSAHAIYTLREASQSPTPQQN